MNKKKLYYWMVIGLILSLLPQGSSFAQNDPQPLASEHKLFLPIVRDHTETQHTITFVAGSFSVGTNVLGDCDFTRAEQTGNIGASASPSVCPVPDVYMGLEVIADGVSQLIALPWRESNKLDAIYTGAANPVTNVGVIKPDELLITLTTTIPIDGPITGTVGVKVLEIPLALEVSAAAGNSPTALNPFEVFSFQNKLKQFMDQRGAANVFVVESPTVVPFWDVPTGLTSKFVGSCGYKPTDAGARWVGFRPRMKGYPPNWRYFIEGVFLGNRPDNPNITMMTCMGQHRMILVADLLQEPFALPLRNAIVAEVGDWKTNPFKFWSPSWDPELVYSVAYTTIETGIGGYILYEAAKGSLNRATLFLIVPENMLTCLGENPKRCEIHNE